MIDLKKYKLIIEEIQDKNGRYLYFSFPDNCESGNPLGCLQVRTNSKEGMKLLMLLDKDHYCNCEIYDLETNEEIKL